MAKNSTKNISVRKLELFYMTPGVVSAKDIKELLGTNGNAVQLWEELNVLQIELSNENTVDFEPVMADFKEASDAAFVKNRNVQTIFAVSLAEDDFISAKVYLKSIIEKFDGFLCTDSDDFKPIYLMEDLM